ncbi:GNAT family N-acetyltransferase [Rheinheimera salexigens]|uniref:N-acetyltransferase domain-containing protein n=1 Tax=Rheinheimera salexigens TaxID=1628148 RepID=A0A1E7Q6Q4_9GAMM|nr:GNAT family N-acetyltransferase [Rheinheimera salexigens]OEY69826.1 hypothetical protein BI198_09830 [Rheinheimera salexigens]
MELVTPSIKYQQSYCDYIAELANEERYPFPLDFDFTDFEALLAKLADYAAGKNLPAGYVPSSTLWLVDNDQLLGVTNIRHYLNEQIKHCGGHIGLGIRPSYRGKGLGNLLMRLSIAHLKQKGVTPIHIHCYQDNYASANCIISNGGVLESELVLDEAMAKQIGPVKVQPVKIVQRFIVK